VRTPAVFPRLCGKWLALPGNLRGFIWLSIGTLVLAFADAVLKYLGRTIHPVELSFFRYSVGFMMLAPVFWRMGIPALKTTRPDLHLWRLGLATLGQTGVFFAFVNLKLADATAMWFSKPLFTTVVAIFILSELVPARRWVATFIGFAGVIVMLRPGAGIVDPYALVAVAAALCMAMANVLIRVMAPTEPPNRILFYYHIGGILLLAGPAVWFWRTPTGTEWGLIALLGIGQTIGMICFVRGFSVGEANAVGPSEYVRLIYAGLIGYVIFGEVIDIWTLTGGVIIVGSTLYIARDQARGPRGRADGRES
jgi:drug/metabolite transporter (DMT)-like permease